MPFPRDGDLVRCESPVLHALSPRVDVLADPGVERTTVEYG